MQKLVYLGYRKRSERSAVGVVLEALECFQRGLPAVLLPWIEPINKDLMGGRRRRSASKKAGLFLRETDVGLRFTKA